MEGEGDCKKAQDFPSISHQDGTLVYFNCARCGSLLGIHCNLFAMQYVLCIVYFNLYCLQSFR